MDQELPQRGLLVLPLKASLQRKTQLCRHVYFIVDIIVDRACFMFYVYVYVVDCKMGNDGTLK